MNEELWSWRRELNPRPSDYKSDALPTELRQRYLLRRFCTRAPCRAAKRLERETGIEPATNSLEGCDSTIELLPPWKETRPPEPTHPFYGTKRQPVNSLRKMSGRVGCHLFFLLAEHPYFAVLVVHVHREIVQVIDQLFQILRLELAQVDLHAVFPQGAVHVYARLGRNQAG